MPIIWDTKGKATGIDWETPVKKPVSAGIEWDEAIPAIEGDRIAPQRQLRIPITPEPAVSVPGLPDYEKPDISAEPSAFPWDPGFAKTPLGYFAGRFTSKAAEQPFMGFIQKARQLTKKPPIPLIPVFGLGLERHYKTQMARETDPKKRNEMEKFMTVYDEKTRRLGQPEKYGLITPKMEALRAQRQDEADARGPWAGGLNQAYEGVVDIAAYLTFLRGMNKWVAGGKVGKAPDLIKGRGFITNTLLTARNIWTNPETWTNLSRIGAIRYATTPGEDSERAKSALWAVAYNATPYFANATGAAGMSAIAIDWGLNTLLSTPSYYGPAIEQYDGIQKAVKDPKFLSGVATQLLTDLYFARFTKGLPKAQYDAAVKSYWEGHQSRETMREAEFKTYIKEQALVGGGPVAGQTVFEGKGTLYGYSGVGKPGEVRVVNLTKAQEGAKKKIMHDITTKTADKLKPGEKKFDYLPDNEAREERLRLRADATKEDITKAQNVVKNVTAFGEKIKFNELPLVVQERILSHIKESKGKPTKFTHTLQKLIEQEEDNIYLISGDPAKEDAVVWANGKLMTVRDAANVRGQAGKNWESWRILESEGANAGQESDRTAELKTTARKWYETDRQLSELSEELMRVSGRMKIEVTDEVTEEIAKSIEEGKGGTDAIRRWYEKEVLRRKRMALFPKMRRGLRTWNDDAFDKANTEMAAKRGYIKFDIVDEGDTWSVKGTDVKYISNDRLNERKDKKRVFYGAMMGKRGDDRAIFYNPKYIDKLWKLYSSPEGKRYLPKGSRVTLLPEGLRDINEFRNFVLQHERIHHLTGLDNSRIDEDMINVMALKAIGRQDLAQSLRRAVTDVEAEKKVEPIVEQPAIPVPEVKAPVPEKPTGPFKVRPKGKAWQIVDANKQVVEDNIKTAGLAKERLSAVRDQFEAGFGKIEPYRSKHISAKTDRGYMTGVVNIGKDGKTLIDVPPVWKKFQGKTIDNLLNWLKGISKGKVDVKTPDEVRAQPIDKSYKLPGKGPQAGKLIGELSDKSLKWWASWNNKWHPEAKRYAQAELDSRASVKALETGQARRIRPGEPKVWYGKEITPEMQEARAREIAQEKDARIRDAEEKAKYEEVIRKSDIPQEDPNAIWVKPYTKTSFDIDRENEERAVEEELQKGVRDPVFLDQKKPVVEDRTAPVEDETREYLKLRQQGILSNEEIYGFKGPAAKEGEPAKRLGKTSQYTIDSEYIDYLRRHQAFESADAMITHLNNQIANRETLAKTITDPKLKEDALEAISKSKADLKDFKVQYKELLRQYPEEDDFRKRLGDIRLKMKDERADRDNIETQQDEFNAGLFGGRPMVDVGFDERSMDQSAKLRLAKALIKFAPWESSEWIAKRVFGADRINRWIEEAEVKKTEVQPRQRELVIPRAEELKGAYGWSSFLAMEREDVIASAVEKYVNGREDIKPVDKIKSMVLIEQALNAATEELWVNKEDVINGKFRYGWSDIGLGTHNVRNDYITEKGEYAKVADGVSKGFIENFPAIYEQLTGRQVPAGFANNPIRPIGAYFKILPKELQNMAIWLKIQNNRQLLDLRDAGELTQANIDRNLRNGYTHKAYRKKGAQIKGAGKQYNSMLDNRQDFEMTQKSSDFDDFVYRTRARGLEPHVKASVSNAKYLKDTLDKLSTKRLVDYVASLSVDTQDGQKRPAIVHIGKHYPEKDVKGNIVQAVMSQGKAQQLGYVEMQNAPSFVLKKGYSFLPPYVHKSLASVMNDLWSPERSRVMTGALKLKGMMKKHVMATPVIFAFQSASSTWLHRPGKFSYLGVPTAKAIWQKGIWPIISGELFRGAKKSFTEIKRGEDRAGDRFLGYDRDRLELAIRSNLGGIRIEDTMAMLYDASKEKLHPAYRTQLDTLRELIDNRGGLARYAFNNYLAKQIFEVFNFKVDELKNRGFSEKRAGRMAAHFLNDITGMTNRGIYGNEANYLQLLFFARDYTYTFLRQLSGAMTGRAATGKSFWRDPKRILDIISGGILRPEWHQKLAAGAEWGKIPVASRLLNPIWHKELKAQELGAMRGDYVGQVLKVLLWKMLFVNMMQMLMGEGLSTENEYGKKMMARTSTKYGENKRVHLDFLMFREAAQYISLLGGPWAKYVSQGASSWLLNKIDPIISSFIIGVYGIDPRTGQKVTWRTPAVGWRENIQNYGRYLFERHNPDIIKGITQPSPKTTAGVAAEFVIPARRSLGIAAEEIPTTEGKRGVLGRPNRQMWREAYRQRWSREREAYEEDRFRQWLRRIHPDKREAALGDALGKGWITIDRYRRYLKGQVAPVTYGIRRHERTKIERELREEQPPWLK